MWQGAGIRWNTVFSHARCKARGEVWTAFVVFRARCVTSIRTYLWIKQIRIKQNKWSQDNKGMSNTHKKTPTYLSFCSQHEPHTCPSPCLFPSSCHTSALKTPAERTFYTRFLSFESQPQIICLLVRRRRLHKFYWLCSANMSQGKRIYCLRRGLPEMSWPWLPSISPHTTHTTDTKSIFWLWFNRHIPSICMCVLRRRGGESSAVNWFNMRLNPWGFTTREYTEPLQDQKIYYCYLGEWVSSLWALIRLVVCGYC